MASKPVFAQPVSLVLGAQHALWWSPPWPLTCWNPSLIFIWHFLLKLSIFSLWSLFPGLFLYLLLILSKSFFSVSLLSIPWALRFFPSSVLDLDPPFPTCFPLAVTFTPAVCTTICCESTSTSLGLELRGNGLDIPQSLWNSSHFFLFTCKFISFSPICYLRKRIHHPSVSPFSLTTVVHWVLLSGLSTNLRALYIFSFHVLSLVQEFLSSCSDYSHGFLEFFSPSDFDAPWTILHVCSQVILWQRNKSAYVDPCLILFMVSLYLQDKTQTLWYGMHFGDVGFQRA